MIYTCIRCSKPFVSYPSHRKNGDGLYCSSECKSGETRERRARPLTASRLREVLSYDRDTGIFRWKITIHGRRRVGDRAGWITYKGYRMIEVDGKQFPAHHLAWLYIFDCFPAHILDHKNRDRDDNRIDNLREATNNQNRANSSANSGTMTGYKGVTKRPNGRYIAQATVNKKPIYLGSFSTAEEASKVYINFAKKVHGEFFHQG